MKATAISVYYVDPNFLLNIHIPPDMTLKRLKQLTVIYIYIYSTGCFFNNVHVVILQNKTIVFNNS